MKRRWFDLTYPIKQGMPVFPSHWHPAVKVTQLARHSVEKRESRRLVLGTHSGTHVDAPLHFVPGGARIDAFPAELMMGRAGLIDLSPAKPGKEYTLRDIRTALGRRRVTHRMLLRFGWTHRYGSLSFYSDAPYPSLEACEWLASRGVRLLGMDTPSVDAHGHGWKSGNDAPNHRALLGRGLFLVESMARLDQLSGSTVNWLVFPLRIAGADGAPARSFGANI